MNQGRHPDPLWLLTGHPGTTRLRLDPGVYHLPAWYQAPEAFALAELIRLLSKSPLHVVHLPEAAFKATEPRIHAPERALVVIRRSAAAPPQALPDLNGAIVLCWGAPHALPLTWIERDLKPPLLQSLRRCLAAPEHPLAGFHVDRLDVNEAAARTADPILMLKIVALCLDHRLSFAAQGLLPPDYNRSLLRAVGLVLADRLAAIPDPILPECIDHLLGLDLSDDARARAHQSLLTVGLAFGSVRDPQLMPLCRDLHHPPLLAALQDALPRPALTEAARQLIASHVPPPAVDSPASLPAQPFIGTSAQGIVNSLQEALATLASSPPAFPKAMAALQALADESWNREPAALSLIPDVMIGLQSAQSSPDPSHQRTARLLAEALDLISCRNPADIARAEASLAKIEHLLGSRAEPWQQTLIEESLLFLLNLLAFAAASADDLDRALNLNHRLKALSIPEGRRSDRIAGETASVFSSIHYRRGQYDEALRILQDEAVPVFTRLGDLRSLAVAKATMGVYLVERDQVGDRETARGVLVEAWRLVVGLGIPEAGQFVGFMAQAGLGAPSEEEEGGRSGGGEARGF